MLAKLGYLYQRDIDIVHYITVTLALNSKAVNKIIQEVKEQYNQIIALYNEIIAIVNQANSTDKAINKLKSSLGNIEGKVSQDNLNKAKAQSYNNFKSLCNNIAAIKDTLQKEVNYIYNQITKLEITHAVTNNPSARKLLLAQRQTPNPKTPAPIAKNKAATTATTSTVTATKGTLAKKQASVGAGIKGQETLSKKVRAIAEEKDIAKNTGTFGRNTLSRSIGRKAIESQK